MCTRKQLGLAALLLMLGPLMAMVAVAGKNADYERYPNLTCKLTSTGIEPDASGQAKLKEAVLMPAICPWWPSLWMGLLSVSARSLTPGETYSVEYFAGTWISLGLFTADEKGELNAEDDVSFEFYNYGTGASVAVAVVNASGNPVLQGSLVLK